MSIPVARDAKNDTTEEALHNPPSISAEELHARLVRAHRLGNRLRREYIQTLLALDESWLFVKLGFSSVYQYAERYFGYAQAESYEMLRVAKALRELPRSGRAFDRGEISWSALKHISRLAQPAANGRGNSKNAGNGEESEPVDEEAWLEFAQSHSVRRLRAEVRQAIRKGRRTPRRDGDSMPRAAVRVVLEFTPEDHDIVVKAFRKVAVEARKSLGGDSMGPEQALLLMSRRWLETDDAGMPRGRSEREESPFTVLYHLCQRCHEATLPTPDGAVEIPREAVERVEAVARKVTIDPEEESPKSESSTHSNGNGTESSGSEDEGARDRPNSSTLTRKVVLRDGQVCSNPMCRRRLGLHAHHIQFRSQGGRTELCNEAAVCSTCHSLIHQGYLAVEGDPVRGLHFHARAEELSAPDFEQDLRLLAALEVREEPASGPARPGNGTPGDYARAENSGNFPRGDEEPAVSESRSLLKALRQLGFSKTSARDRLREAEAQLREKHGRRPTEQELFVRAVKN